MKTKPGPAERSGHAKARRGKARSSALRLWPISTTSRPPGFRCAFACARIVRVCARPSAAARERHLRLAPELLGQAAHRRRLHVGRIGHDEVVPAALQRGEEVGLHEAHALAEAIGGDVLPRDGQRVAGEIRGIDLRAAEGESREDGQAAGARAEIQRRAHLRGPRDPGRQARPQQFRDEGARHDHALVHVEAVRAQPGLVHEIGRGLARADALRDEGIGGLRADGVDGEVEIGSELVHGEAQRVQHEPGGLVDGVGRAVPERDLGLLEPLRGREHEAAHGNAFRGDGPGQGGRYFTPSRSAQARR